MRNVWTSVKVKTSGHPREGQAGVVHAVNPDVADEVAVKFDADGIIAAVKIDDLQQLA